MSFIENLSSKNIFLFSLLAGSSIATPFILTSSKTNENIFSLSKSNGLTTRVRLFIDGLNSNSLTQETFAAQSNLINRYSQIHNYQIEQVSHKQVSSSLKEKDENRTPDLIAEFSLKNLNDSNYWKFCLPEGSKLNSNSHNHATTSQSNSVAQNSSAKVCNPNWLSYQQKEGNIEEIKELLKTLVWFLQVEHVTNMLWLYKKDSEIYSDKKNNGGDIKQKLQKIKSTCGLRDDTPKGVLNDLFFSNSWSKKCLLSPITMKVNLDLKINNYQSSISQQTESNSSGQNQKITKELISKGIIKGRLNYALFNYWGQAQKIENGQNKFPLFRFNSQRKYSLNNESKGFCNLNLEEMYKLVSSRQLNWEILLKKYNSSCKQK